MWERELIESEKIMIDWLSLEKKLWRKFSENFNQKHYSKRSNIWHLTHRLHTHTECSNRNKKVSKNKQKHHTHKTHQKIMIIFVRTKHQIAFRIYICENILEIPKYTRKWLLDHYYHHLIVIFIYFVHSFYESQCYCIH